MPLDDDSPPRSRPARDRSRSRRRALAWIAAGLLVGYLGSYAWLSRRGMAEARDDNGDGFLYMRVEELARTGNPDRHYALLIFYAPANWADRNLLGGPSPATCLMKLSG